MACSACQQTPAATTCPSEALALPAEVTLLVHDVTTQDDGAITIRAVVFNATTTGRLVSETGEGVPATWGTTLNERQLLSGRTLEFTVREKVRVHVESEEGRSTVVTIDPPKVSFERPVVPDLQLVSTMAHGFMQLWIPVAKPAAVHLFDGRERGLPEDSFQCLPSTSPWLSDFVTVCELWFFDEKDGVGFRGSKVQAVVDTSGGPVITRKLKLR